MDTVLKVKNLGKTFKENEVLSNIDFEIKKGEMVAITGKSGRGKSTLLNILGLITEKSSGTIYHFEHKNTAPHSKEAMLLRREKIGYLFQNYGLVEEENVEWNLKLALKYKKISGAEKKRRIKELLIIKQNKT